MIRPKILLAVVATLISTAALAQSSQRTGSLSIQNNLAEIEAGGSGAQATARGNLGFGQATPVTSVFGRTGTVTLQSSDVAAALGYLPLAPNGSGAALAGLSAGQISGLAASATTDTTNAGNITAGTLPATRLPFPGLTALGGVQAIAGTPHQWVAYIDTSGVPHQSQPAASDVYGLAPSATTDTTNAENIGSGVLPVGRLTGIQPDVQQFASSGTWTKPAFCSSLTCITRLRLIGGGGGGGGGAMEPFGTVGSGGGSGGGGACFDVTTLTSRFASTVSVTIGAGGIGGAGGTSGAGSNGLVGGNTTFGSSTAFAGGGGGGGQTAANSGGGAGGGNTMVGQSSSGSTPGVGGSANGTVAGGNGNQGAVSSFGGQNTGGAGASASSQANGIAAPCVGGSGSGGVLLSASATSGGFGSPGGLGSVQFSSVNAVGSGDLFPSTSGAGGGNGNASGAGGNGGGAATGAYGCGGAGGGAGTTKGGTGGTGCQGYAVAVTTGS